MRSSISFDGLTQPRLKLLSKIHKLKSQRQLRFLDFVSDMNKWEFEVFDAFRARLRVDELKQGTVAEENYRLFIENPDDEVARILVSADLHSWRPVGIGIFAELVKIHQQREDNAIIDAISKSSTIGTKKFREEYPHHTSKVTPKSILETVLQEDYNITLNTKKIDTSNIYDGLREKEED